MSSREMTTWRELIAEEMKRRGESWEHVVDMTLTEEGLDVKFYAGFGGAEGKPFTLWTHERVYFPTEYDGAEGVASAPRFPNDEIMEHV